ncbi:poly(ethylene terephthalate) hydrolase family protein [Algoriphagus limi]|uniref:Alpha/beta hydrolase family protein n=1 Tax=Algoriphagus limi TaxID=2975273 RepID=A0ABT2G4J8_9BACT|nr:hypothetical protein [Algoriphagus limi]MCS5490196.1 hypothetical protein [Algoriphagus limi]
MKQSLKSYFLRLKSWIGKQLQKIKPGLLSVKGAAIGLIIGSVIFFVIEVLGTTINFKDPWILALGAGIILISLLGSYLSVWLVKQFYEIPRSYKIALFLAIPLLFIVRMQDERIVLYLVVVFSLLGAGFPLFKKGHFKHLKMPKKVVAVLGFGLGIVGLVAFLYFLSIRGLDIRPLINAAKLVEDKIEPLKGDSPGNNGNYEVDYFTYGSGKDIRREEYAEGVRYVTPSVDGTAFLDHWEGLSGKYRSYFWGFDYRELPINGRVWKPKGKGPFPLVLIVHGNHPMQDFSDPGYAYLGELLASRGIILVSVDENFINGSWSDIPDGLEKENDARAWLLLEHLKQWKAWNEDPQHELSGQIAMDKLALIGHSRGGEAVGHAAMLNQLDFYPDDASIPLGYHFDIQSVIAIAPVDGQYKPGNSLTKIENVSYLGIHGAQDSDVESFDAAKQFERISFTDSAYHFKAGIYIAGANHGQFNTSWGDNDVLATFSGILNKNQLMDAADQEQIAKVYISAFLETTLLKKRDYLPLFADARKGRNWLPETIYLSQFEDSNSQFWADFDEDFDVVSLTEEGNAKGENLTVWREGEIIPKYGLKGTRAVFLGWNYKEFGGDSVEWESSPKPQLPDSVRASYIISLGENNSRPDSSSVLIFSLAESNESSNPKSRGKWVKKNESNEEELENESIGENEVDEEQVVESENIEEEKEGEAEKPLSPIDFTIELTDQQGERVTFMLSEFSPLQRLIKSRVMKIQFLDDKDETESVFQLYQFDLQKLKSLNPAFQPKNLYQIRFIFDQSEEGVIVLDKVGIMKNLESLSFE